MRKIREVLRLHASGHSRREIGRSLGISHNTAGAYLHLAAEAGLDWPACEDVDDATLEGRLFPPAPAPGKARPLPDWNEIHRELRRKGVTLQLLWLEYKAAHPEGYQYTQFVTYYRRWCGSIEVVMRQEHTAGEKAFVDYAGQTLAVIDPATGEERDAQIFVGVLGASNYTYAEAGWTQTLPEWIGAHVRMYAYFKGVPRVTVPDNITTGVRHACFFEPDLNPTYLEMARHYGTVIIPTRTAKPRDKAKVETGVQIVERWVLAPLRNHTFFGLAEANAAIADRLEWLNNRPFQKLAGNRRLLFEQLDRPALQPLPAVPYTFAIWKKARVSIDYHVAIEYHNYSVPYQLKGKEVEARITSSTVEILFKGKRVATHRRSYTKGGYSTESSHRPDAHRRNDKWPPSRLVRWGKSVGDATGALVERILENQPHPEKGYRSCLGLLRLGKQYSPERLEAACRRALESGARSYRSVKSILEHGLDQVPLEQTTLVLPDQHENVRGPEYYHV